MKLIQLSEFESKYLPMDQSEIIITGVSDCIALNLPSQVMCDCCLKKLSKTCKHRKRFKYSSRNACDKPWSSNHFTGEGRKYINWNKWNRYVSCID